MTTIAEALEQAVTHHRAGRVEQAKFIYERVLQGYPDQADALNLLAAIHQTEGNHRLAFDLASRAVTLDPAQARYHYILGQAQFGLHQYTDSETSFRRASQLPGTPQDNERCLTVATARVGTLRHMESIVARRPIAIALETTTLCNSRCVFCVYRKLKRPKTIMSMALFEKICDEFSDLGGGLIGFNPLMSDPLVDPLFLDRLRRIVERYRLLTPHLFTNAIGFARFSDAEVSYILRYMDYIDVSIGGIDRAGYKIMFGVDRFESVWEQLERLSRLNQALGNPCILQLHVRTNRLEEVEASAELAHLRSLGYVVADVINAFANWGGDLSRDELPSGTALRLTDNSGNTTPCLAPMMYYSVLPDGRVAACSCMDGRESVIVGDANRQTIAEVWNGPVLESFRDTFRRNEVCGLCRQCYYYMPYKTFLSTPRLANYRVKFDVWKFNR